MNDRAAAAESVLHVPDRRVPAPGHLSAGARASLVWRGTPEPPPALDEIEAWRDRVRRADAQFLQVVSQMWPPSEASVGDATVDGVRIFQITPVSLAPNATEKVYLDIHGGGLAMGGGEICRITGIRSAERAGVRTWTVDYRMPPDHPYPAALDDCVTAYGALLRDHRPEEIIVGGGSAGGNLAAALVLRARDEGLPLPAAAVLITPEVDLTESGDSFQTNMGVDTVLTTSLLQQSLLYAGGHDLAHPYLSPLFGDFSKGFPPTFLQAGTRDLFLSNAVRMHRALRGVGVEAELHVFEAMPHGGFFGAPEDQELDLEMRRFIDAHWGRR